MRKVYIALLLCGSAFAQIPNAPSAIKKPENVWLAPLKHPEFYAGVGVFSASAYADIHHVRHCEANLTCVEAYKGHDHYSYMVPQILFVAGMTYGCEIMLTEHKWWRRTVCPGIGIGLSIIRWKDANTIYKNDLVARP